mgnify:CR=1 FL=1
MTKFKLFIELTRLNKPTGYMLLFWPCMWGLTIAYDFTNNLNQYLFYSFLFFSGSVLMRSAGCIVNDIVDRNFDRKVERTRNRPVAAKKISVLLASIYSMLLCLIALLVLINFNNYTILLAFASMPLAFSYPFIKRFTYWPQLFLGITFNYGLILGWTAINGQIDIAPVIFYLGAIFWTLGFDTIYGFQDIADDEIIGVRSTSIKFKKNPKYLITTCYIFFILSLLITGSIMKLNYLYFIFLIPIIFHLINQVKKLMINSTINCFKIFKSNNTLGLLIFVNLLIGKL